MEWRQSLTGGTCWPICFLYKKLLYCIIIILNKLQITEFGTFICAENPPNPPRQPILNTCKEETSQAGQASRAVDGGPGLGVASPGPEHRREVQPPRAQGGVGPKN